MTPDKFTHAGLDWHPHTPGDPMPCPGDTMVRVLMRSDLDALCDVTNYETSASIWDWDVCPAEPMAEIIGWHPVEN
jgi:hypothetical protein